MAGHSRPKDGVLSHAYITAIHILLSLEQPEDVDAWHKAGHDDVDQLLDHAAGDASAGLARRIGLVVVASGMDHDG